MVVPLALKNIRKRLFRNLAQTGRKSRLALKTCELMVSFHIYNCYITRVVIPIIPQLAAYVAHCYH